MKNQSNLAPRFTPPASLVTLLLAFILHHSTFILPASAQGTAFTYQGRLNSGASVANGSFDLQFAVYDAASGGLKQAPFITNAATAVSNGLFTVTLDFGTGVFPGAARWLDIGVRTNGGGTFTLLAPRQALTATPYAVFAGGASNLVGAVSSANLAGTYSQALTLNNPGNVFTGNGAGVTNVNAVTLNGLGSGAFWQLGGNNVSPGQFLGSTNNQPVEFKVNGQRALRLENNGDGSDADTLPDGAPNIIGGSVNNFVSAGVVGATIGGGGSTNFDGYLFGRNGISADYATIGGGLGNNIPSGSVASTIAGGYINGMGSNAPQNSIGGGVQNVILNNTGNATIAGGSANLIGASASASSIGGGSGNSITAASPFSVIAGGFFNLIGTSSYGSTIAGGLQNIIGTNSTFSTIGGGHTNVIGANSVNATIAGGLANSASGISATIGGGELNSTMDDYATVGGGLTNTASGLSSTIGGGAKNVASGRSATVGGGGDINNVFNYANRATGNYSTVAGGAANTAGGFQNATVGGGFANNASGQNSTIGGGYGNSASGNSSVVAGGEYNQATNTAATVPGGSENIAGGQYSLAAGRSARAIHDGSFVWADSTGTTFASTAANQFLIRAGGGVGINTSNPVVPLTVEGSGAYNALGAAAIVVRNPTANKSWEWHVLNDGRMQFADLGAGATRMLIDTNGNVSANSFITTSDRNAKENFSPVNAQDVLAKVAALPITQWNFKSETAVQHVGPMAQDFRAAFGLGPDEKHIATVDADGVALAAIQGLNEKLEARSQNSAASIQKLETENAALKAQLNELKVLVKQLAEGTAK